MLLKKLAHIDPDTDPFHDFRNFMYHEFTEVLKYGEPDPIQYDIAAYLMDMARKGQDGKVRKQIQAMRGCGKSVIAAIFCCWLWYCNPTIRIVYIGSNQDLTDASAKLVKYMLDNSPLLSHLKPQDEDQYQMRHGRKLKNLGGLTNQVSKFDVRGAGPHRDPSFTARPVFGGWTGHHPDIFLCDDCEIPENSLTELKRKRLMAKLLEAESLVLEDGMILYMGTPQTEDSIYLKLHAQGYLIRRWPAELPNPADEKQTENVSPWLIERAEEEWRENEICPSYPERFGVEVLLEKMAKSRAYYNLQMLLNPNLADEERYPLKLRNAIVFNCPSDMAPRQIVWGTTDALDHIEHAGRNKDCWFGPGFVSPEYEPFQGKVMYIDPKGGGADSVGYAVVGFLNGVVYVLDAGALAPGQSGTSVEVLRKLARTAFEFEVKHIIVESNWGGSKDESTYAKLLQPIVAEECGAVQITVNHVSGQKEVRILDCLEPIFNCHRIVFSERAAACLDLSGQIGKITRERGALLHDDVIDALYGAVAHYADKVVLDPAAQAEKQAEADRKAVAKEFDDWTKKNTSWLGNKPKQRPGPMRRGGWGRAGQRRW